MIGGLWKSTGSAALLTAAGLYLGGVGVSPAQAADLGGDCCADLEERVAELEATTARKGNRRVSLTISGAVTTHLMYWNDGNDVDGSDLYIVDNVAGAGTNINFTGSARINPNLTAGFQLSFSFFNGSRSHQVTQLDDDGGNGGDTNIVSHLSNWWLDHKQFGRITVGRINTATAGITTIDLGGAGVIANASFGYWQRGMSLVDGGPFVAATWNDAFGGSDVSGASLSRANAISYTSPTFGGFSVAAAWGEDDIWDVALRYAGEFSGFRVAAGIGYINNSSGLNEIVKDHLAGNEPNIWKGSASVLHVSSGLFLTGAYLDKDWNDGGPNTTMWYVQGGISKNWTGMGRTVLYGEYAQVDDGTLIGASSDPLDADVVANGLVTGTTGSLWGLGIVQHVDAAAMELYVAYRRFSADMTTADGRTLDFNDMDVVVGGARIRF